MTSFVFVDNHISMSLKTSSHEKIVLKGIMSELRRTCSQILCSAKQLGYSDDDTFAVHLSLEEAVVNAVKHGNRADCSKNVTIEYDITPEKIRITVTDEGGGFEPGDVADPRAGENIYKTGGRGVLLIKSYMDSIEYNQSGNSITMTKINGKLPKQGEIR
ncbi:MAG: ATP-binding protein [Planctomycetaceae bacterium]|nr:ATP-binding protein [Planctomycetaceae bacterium]